MAGVEREARHVGRPAIGQPCAGEVGDGLPGGEGAPPVGRRLDRHRRRSRPDEGRKGEPERRIGMEHGVLAERQAPAARLRACGAGRPSPRPAAPRRAWSPARPSRPFRARRRSSRRPRRSSRQAPFAGVPWLRFSAGSTSLAAKGAQKKSPRSTWRIGSMSGPRSPGAQGAVCIGSHAPVIADVEGDVGEMAAGLGDAERHPVGAEGEDLHGDIRSEGVKEDHEVRRRMRGVAPGMSAPRAGSA